MSSSSSSSSSSSFSPSLLQDFINLRCGTNIFNDNNDDDDDTKTVVWQYEGVLMDPLDGRKIANVEGLELVRPLATLSSSSTQQQQQQQKQQDRFKRRCRNLKIVSAMTKRNTKDTNNNDTTTVSCATVLTRKLFCYKPIVSSSSSSSSSSTSSEQQQQQQQQAGSLLLLDKFKRRPGGVTTYIPTEQSVQVYDAATSYIERRQKQSNNQDETEWIVHTEWPDGTGLKSTSSFTTTLQTKNQNDDKQFSFTTYTRPFAKKSQIPDLTTQTTTNSKQKQRQRRTTTRASTIQFGSSPETEQGKFGARETYHYHQQAQAQQPAQTKTKSSTTTPVTTTTTTTTVHYTRYGEAPIWYGPGRMCLLELHGTRLDSTTTSKSTSKSTSTTSKSSLTQSLAAQIPNFWNRSSNKSKKGVINNNNNSDDAVHFKYYSDAMKSQLLLVEDDDDDEDVQPSYDYSAQDYQEIFADLKVGRAVDAFRNSPQQYKQLAKSMGITTTTTAISSKGALLPITPWLSSNVMTTTTSNNNTNRNGIVRFSKTCQRTVGNAFDRFRKATSFSI